MIVLERYCGKNNAVGSVFHRSMNPTVTTVPTLICILQASEWTHTSFSIDICKITNSHQLPSEAWDKPVEMIYKKKKKKILQTFIKGHGKQCYK